MRKIIDSSMVDVCENRISLQNRYTLLCCYLYNGLFQKKAHKSVADIKCFVCEENSL